MFLDRMVFLEAGLYRWDGRRRAILSRSERGNLNMKYLKVQRTQPDTGDILSKFRNSYIRTHWISRLPQCKIFGIVPEFSFNTWYFIWPKFRQDALFQRYRDHDFISSEYFEDGRFMEDILFNRININPSYLNLSILIKILKLSR